MTRMTPEAPRRVRRRALLVDLDDTLFDHRAAYRAGLESLRGHHPVLGRIPRTTLVRRYRELLEESHPAVVRGEMAPSESRRRRIQALFLEAGVEPTSEGLARAIQVYQAGYRSHQRAVPGARGLLNALHPGWTIVVVTNHLRSEQVTKLAELGLTPWIDGLVTAEDVPFPKPAPDPFREALRVAHVPPSRAVVLGDSWETDVVGATAAGIRPVWLNRDHERAPLPGVEELPALVPIARALQMIEHGTPLPPPGRTVGVAKVHHERRVGGGRWRH